MAENFQGRNLLWIGEKYDFRGENFRRLLTFAATKDTTSLNFRWRKLSRIATKPLNLRKFSPSKVWFTKLTPPSWSTALYIHSCIVVVFCQIQHILLARCLYAFVKVILSCFINIIQLIFLQQYFPIPVPCNITRYCTARVLLHGCYCTGPGAMRYPSNHDVL